LSWSADDLACAEADAQTTARQKIDADASGVNDLLTIAGGCIGSYPISGRTMSRVAREIVSVLPDPVAGEVNIVVSGYRISLTADEAASLARGVLNCLGQLRWGEKRAAGIAMASPPAAGSPEAPRAAAADGGPRPAASPAAVEPDAVQQRHRTLIQASIRDKGLSLREERRS
jgi:hypothetical protein